MKRIIIAALLLGVTSTVLSVGKAYAGPPCEDKDLGHFPYGFVCPNDGDDTRALKLTNSYYNIDDPQHKNHNGDPRSPEPYKKIPYGSLSNIIFNTVLDPSGVSRVEKNGPQREILMWTTIDINDSQVTGIYAPGGVVDGCPTSRSGGAGVYRAVNPLTTSTTIGGKTYSDNTASPYNDLRSNKVDCTTQGRMVWWKYPSSGNYSQGFVLGINSQRPGKFCVRTQLSVGTIGADFIKYNFPPAGQSTEDWESVASHLAKKSTNQCFEVMPKVVTPSPPVNGCSRYNAADDGTLDGDPSVATYTTVEISGVWPAVGVNGIPTDAWEFGKVGVYSYGFPYGKGTSKVWDYIPVSKDVTVTLKRFGYINGKFQLIWGYPQVQTFRNCLSTGKPPGDPIPPDPAAGCSVSFTGPGPNGKVLAGQPYSVTVRMQNNGQLNLTQPYGFTPWRLGVAGEGGEHDLGYGLAVGDVGQMDFQLTAPDGPANHPISFTPRFNGGGPDLGGTCTTTVPVYKYFALSPSVSLVGFNQENPTTVTYRACVSKSEGPDVRANAAAWLTKQPHGAGEATVHSGNATRDYGGEQCDEYTYNNPSIAAGDNFCAYLSVNPATGYRGPGGVTDIVGGAPNNPPAKSACDKVVNRPYVHFFGADVQAGGGFGNNCSTTNGGIYTYVNKTATPALKATGSGVQFAALSINANSGFSSALLRGSSPFGSTGLTFANTTNVNGDGPGAPGTGGYLGGTHCASDYFGTKSPELKTPTTQTSMSLTGVTGTKYIAPSSGALTINASNIVNGQNVVLYVRGNVNIIGDIKYTSTNWGPLEAIPSVRIISYGGNITIGSNVSQLDGLYVSQPDTAANGGNIYTCDVFTYPAAFPICKRQLLVNGAFVAKHVHLLRTFGSLRNSQPGEYITNTPRSCGDSGNTALGDCSSEVFNFTPEVYLGMFNMPDQVVPDSGPTTGKYDYISSLAPVL